MNKHTSQETIEAIYQFLVKWFEENELGTNSPTQLEIAKALNFNHSTVSYAIKNLVVQKRITFIRSKSHKRIVLIKG